jgi:hypothetical protein
LPGLGLASIQGWVKNTRAVSANFGARAEKLSSTISLASSQVKVRGGAASSGQLRSQWFR